MTDEADTIDAEVTVREMETKDGGVLPVLRRASHDAPGTDLLMPITSGDKLVEAMRAYEDVRLRLMTARDYQRTRDGNQFPKKSYFIKLAIAYGVTLKIKEGYPRLEYDAGGTLWRAEVIVQAIAPSGRVTEGLGVCTTNEPRYRYQYDSKDGKHFAGEAIKSAMQKLDHDLPATAETRAKNRACATMFGWEGEVSWEEVTGDGETGGAFNTSESPAQRSAAPKASPNKDASANQLATIFKLSRLLGKPEPDERMTSAEASERITILSREYNERKGSGGR